MKHPIIAKRQNVECKLWQHERYCKCPAVRTHLFSDITFPLNRRPLHQIHQILFSALYSFDPFLMMTVPIKLTSVPIELTYPFLMMTVITNLTSALLILQKERGIFVFFDDLIDCRCHSNALHPRRVYKVAH